MKMAQAHKQNPVVFVYIHGRTCIKDVHTRTCVWLSHVLKITPLLFYLTLQVGREWKMLSRHLNVSEIDIDSIGKEHHGDLREAALKALLQLVCRGVYMYMCIHVWLSQSILRCIQ